MDRISAANLGMPFVGQIDQCGNMLGQSAAEGNLDYLQAAADSEHGLPRQAEPSEQAELHLVAVGLHAACLGVGGLAVAGWDNVATPVSSRASNSAAGGRG